MTSDVNEAIEALELAADLEDNIDCETYQAAYKGLVELRLKILRYDQRVNFEQRAPTGDDYNNLWSMLNLGSLDTDIVEQMVPVADKRVPIDSETGKAMLGWESISLTKAEYETLRQKAEQANSDVLLYAGEEVILRNIDGRLELVRLRAVS